MIDIVTPQVLGVIGAVIIAIAVFEALRRGIVPERFAALWIIISGLLLILAAFPQIGVWATRVTGVELPTNLLFFLAALLLLLISVQFSYEIGKLDSRTRRLAEEVALLQNMVEEHTGSGPENGNPPDWRG